ncbi:MAG TPA: phosphohistidine phosphatase SixA [Bryobacteraceae bacterium]|nr:phosphohistidine phosphatase SixA [Bryobacteraceae bacterium]
MQVYILRHGIAEEGSPGGRDADRQLTNEGRKRLREVLRLAETADVLPTRIISSPYVRAVQTAEVAIDVLGYSEDLLKTEALIPSSNPESVWDELRLHEGVSQVMLVGHEPLLSRVVAFLLNAPLLAVDMKKAALVRIDIESFGPQPHGILKWMLVPKLAG